MNEIFVTRTLGLTAISTAKLQVSRYFEINNKLRIAIIKRKANKYNNSVLGSRLSGCEPMNYTKAISILFLQLKISLTDSYEFSPVLRITQAFFFTHTEPWFIAIV